MLNARALSTFCMSFGAVGILVEFADFFPEKSGAPGTIGAILVGAGLITFAITEITRRDE